MDFSKLSSNEKLAAYGAIAGVAGAVIAAIGGWGGVLWLTLLLSLAMIAILFLPQWSPQTTLPGSKGSLMLIVGGVAAVSSLLALLSFFSVLGLLAAYGGLAPIGLLIGIVGGLVMGWAAWQQFQAEGGTFQIGTSGSPRPPSPTMSGPMVPPPGSSGRSESMGAPGMTEPTPPPPASTPPPPASTDTDDEAR